MAANSDLPPAYTSLKTPPAILIIDTVEEGDSKCDDGAELLVSDIFEDKTTRLIFIQKVLTIKLLQLLGVTLFTGFVAVFEYNFHYLMFHNIVHLIVTTLIACVVIFILMCCNQPSHQKPFKYIFLVAYPLSIACFFITVTFWTFLPEVAMAWLYHCVAVFALLIYNIFVMQTKFDFDTLHGFYICTGVHVGLYALTVPFYVNPFCLLYPVIVLALEHLYLLFALEVMTSKTYKTALTPDDYVDAAINLHIDYIYIFIKFLVPKIRYAWGKIVEFCIGEINR